MIGPYWQQEEKQIYEIGHKKKKKKKRTETTKEKIDFLVGDITGFLT
jgi:hypothetical protein